MMPSRHHTEDDARADEPQETRELTKKALHARLSNDYYVPDHKHRGVNRAYLVGVFTGAHYRIPLLEFKRFDAELTPSQKKKCPILCGSDAVVKINRLLEETHRPGLGFAPGVFPDEVWFLNVARFIDKANVTGIFFESIPDAVSPDCISTRMTTAKRAAETYLMGEQDLLANASIYQQVKQVWESHKRLVARRMEVQALVTHGRQVEQRMNEEEGQLNSKLLKTAMTIFSYGNNLDNPADQIFHEEDGNAHRLQLAQITQM